MDKRVITYVAAGFLAVIGAGLLFLSLRGDDDEQVAVDEAAVAVDEAEEAPESIEPVEAEEAGDAEPATLTSTEPAPVAMVAAPAVEVPEDLVQISFALNTERAFSGQFRPGDLVGVMASYTDDGVGITDLILQKILVSAIREEAPLPIDEGDIDRLPSAPVGRFFVTLALSADDAESLTNVLEFGSIWLINEPETAIEDSPGVESLSSVLTDDYEAPSEGDNEPLEAVSAQLDDEV